MSSTATTTAPATTPPSTPGSNFFGGALVSAFALGVPAAVDVPVPFPSAPEPAPAPVSRHDVSLPASTVKGGDVARATPGAEKLAATTYVPGGTSTARQAKARADAGTVASVCSTSGGSEPEGAAPDCAGKSARSLVMTRVRLVSERSSSSPDDEDELDEESKDHWSMVLVQTVELEGGINWKGLGDEEGVADDVVLVLVPVGEAVEELLSSSSSPSEPESSPRRAYAAATRNKSEPAEVSSERRILVVDCMAAYVDCTESPALSNRYRLA